MSLKLVDRYSAFGVLVKVYRDSHNNEYCLRLFKGGIEQVAAEYYTNDRADALGTAKLMINQGEKV
jgi:hypothetical protein